MTGECGNIGTPPVRLVLGPFNQYKVTQIDQISLPPYVKHVLAPQDDFGMQKNLAKKNGFGSDPPP